MFESMKRPLIAITILGLVVLALGNFAQSARGQVHIAKPDTGGTAQFTQSDSTAQRLTAVPSSSGVSTATTQSGGLGLPRPPVNTFNPGPDTVSSSTGPFFSVRSWQTGPRGNAKSPSGKCLDYGASPSGNGATVFLNDCDKANPIRVVEIGDHIDGQGNRFRVGSRGTRLYHEVMLFAGKQVIGIHHPTSTTFAQAIAPSSSYPTEYQLQLQVPYDATPLAKLSNPANQIFRLDGDSIILEGSSVDPMTGAVVPGPCINTFVTIPPFCPDPQPQLVIQVQNSRGANGSPLVAAVRNLADDEFWDFVAQDGSGKFPTRGFVSMAGSPGIAPTPITTNWQLWNAICGFPKLRPRVDQPIIYDPTQHDDNQVLTIYYKGCVSYEEGLGWGSIIVVAGGDSNECTNRPDVGLCIDLSNYPPITLPAGVTIRGNRRGTFFGPQLFASYGSQDEGFPCDRNCMLLIEGDYARVTGLRLRGQSRSTDKLPFKTDGIWIDYAGKETSPGGKPPQIPLFSLSTVTELIATVDHNDMSDWMDAAVTVDSPFSVSSQKSKECSYTGYIDLATSPQNLYTCDQYTQTTPYSPGLVNLNPNLHPVKVANSAGTLANIRVARNFLHHNERNEGGYGVAMGNSGGRVLIDGNTFSWNRHDITGSGEPHSEYRALNNLVLSGAPTYSNPFIGRLQDFDMHGTDNVDNTLGSLYFGGAGGYYVEIAETPSSVGMDMTTYCVAIQ